MAKAIAKLFRDPQNAEKAIKELKTHGFDIKEIGILMRQGDEAHLLHSLTKGTASAQASLPEVGTTIGTGPLAAALKQADPGTALTEALGITPEAYEYYRFGILVGGILVSVHDSEERLAKAGAIMRAAVPKPQVLETGAKSPGFAIAERMNATNPMDAPMSGDFRKY
jgi:hypothetical protein